MTNAAKFSFKASETEVLRVVLATQNFSFVFFFQAEDGIRDLIVTGVQTCAFPICRPGMAPAKTTLEFLSACCRLVELLRTPQDIPFLSGLIQREIIYRILGSAEGEIGRASCRERV